MFIKLTYCKLPIPLRTVFQVLSQLNGCGVFPRASDFRLVQCRVTIPLERGTPPPRRHVIYDASPSRPSPPSSPPIVCLRKIPLPPRLINSFDPERMSDREASASSLSEVKIDVLLVPGH